MELMKKLLSLFKAKKKQKVNDLTPRGVSHTIVSKEYIKNFKSWDDHKFNNIQIID